MNFSVVACKQQLTFCRDTRADDKLRLGMTCLIRSASLFRCVYMAINFFKVICKNFLKINTTSYLCLEDLKCRAWWFFFFIPLKYQVFQVPFSLFCYRNFIWIQRFVLCLKQMKQVLSLLYKCGFFALRILGTGIKIVNKSKLLVWNFLFSPLVKKSVQYNIKFKQIQNPKACCTNTVTWQKPVENGI